MMLWCHHGNTNNKCYGVAMVTLKCCICCDGGLSAQHAKVGTYTNTVEFCFKTGLHGTWSTWDMVYVGHGVRGTWSTWDMVYVGHGVRGT